jgi:hypothetical protein
VTVDAVIGPVSAPERDRQLRSVRSLARLLDEAVRIPGIGTKVGLDALLGLVPGAGDALGALLSGWVIVLASRLGAPPAILVRMAGNAALDAIAGSVPLLGDLFDIGWRANSRNVALLERWLAHPRETGASSTALVVVLLVLLAATFVGAVWLAVRLVALLVGALS